MLCKINFKKLMKLKHLNKRIENASEIEISFQLIFLKIEHSYQSNQFEK